MYRIYPPITSEELITFASKMGIALGQPFVMAYKWAHSSNEYWPYQRVYRIWPNGISCYTPDADNSGYPANEFLSINDLRSYDEKYYSVFISDILTQFMYTMRVKYKRARRLFLPCFYDRSKNLFMAEPYYQLNFGSKRACKFRLKPEYARYRKIN